MTESRTAWWTLESSKSMMPPSKTVPAMALMPSESMVVPRTSSVMAGDSHFRWRRVPDPQTVRLRELSTAAAAEPPPQHFAEHFSLGSSSAWNRALGMKKLTKQRFELSLFFRRQVCQIFAVRTAFITRIVLGWTT
jgi:hypothetical protein